MVNLSQKSQELLCFLQSEYMAKGYLYSGSWPYNALKDRGYDKETIHQLLEAGKIQKRDCEDYAFELSSDERGALISKHDLCSVWYEKAGGAMLLDIQQEIRHAADIPVDAKSGEMTVSTIKNVQDNNQPDKIKVTCPFSVGQVIDLEYDLPKELRWSGYHRAEAIAGKRVGQFMVTNIVHNVLVYPWMNMLEIQSLCEEFNKVHSRERTMMVFEDVVLKRMKDNIHSLSDQIQSASTRAAESRLPTDTKVKKPEPER